MRANLSKVLYVEAAHRNPAGGDAQRRLHGHSYKVEVLATGEVDPAVGWIVDYGELKSLFQGVYGRLDHAYLNEVPGLEEDTTLPALERWIVAQLGTQAAWFDGVRVSIVGDLCFRPVRLAASVAEGLGARIFMTFEAAQSLPQLPEGHPCQKLHGHSYRLEVAAEDLDALEMHLGALYELLDHRFLNEVPGLEQATCERSCAWIWEWLVGRRCAPTGMVIQETGSARCVYFGTV